MCYISQSVDHFYNVFLRLIAQISLVEIIHLYTYRKHVSLLYKGNHSWYGNREIPPGNALVSIFIY